YDPNRRAQATDELAVLKPMRLFHFSIAYLALLFVAAAADPFVSQLPIFYLGPECRPPLRRWLYDRITNAKCLESTAARGHEHNRPGAIWRPDRIRFPNRRPCRAVAHARS